jgi:spermidine/putrescine-binding protein
MKAAITHRSVLAAGMLGLALAAMLSAQAQAAERVVLAEYFTSVY